MSEETTTHNTEHAQVAPEPEMPKEPTIDANGVKVYPTSFLPSKSHMEPSRIPTGKMTGFQIEVAHVVIFFLLTFFLFISMWNRPNQR